MERVCCEAAAVHPHGCETHALRQRAEPGGQLPPSGSSHPRERSLLRETTSPLEQGVLWAVSGAGAGADIGSPQVFWDYEVPQASLSKRGLRNFLGP